MVWMECGNRIHSHGIGGMIGRTEQWLLHGDFGSARTEDVRVFCFGEAPSVSTCLSNSFLKLGSIRKWNGSYCLLEMWLARSNKHILEGGWSCTGGRGLGITLWITLSWSEQVHTDPPRCGSVAQVGHRTFSFLIFFLSHQTWIKLGLWFCYKVLRPLFHWVPT